MEQKIQKYNLPMRLFHWVTGVAFLFTLFLGVLLANTDLLKNSTYFNIPLHNSFGVLVFTLVIFRVIIRASSDLPPDPKFSLNIEKYLSKFVHYGLYFFMLEIPLVGYLMSNLSGKNTSFFGLFNLPTILNKNKELSGVFYNIHEISAYIALVFVGFHILATVKHLIFNKENLMRRMV